MSKIENKTAVVKVLADFSRYQIIELLTQNHGTMCVNDIAEKMDITASAVSHQLAKLERMSIVEPRRNGKTICYVLRDNQLVQKIIQIMEIL